MQTVYIETTIPSYLGAHPSRQEPMASHQKLTHRWWNDERHKFLLYSSVLVRLEASRGDANAAQRRLAYLNGITELDVLPETVRLEADLIRLFQLPLRAAAYAGHLAMAILHRMDYLLTWNCTHLANATLQKELMDYCLYHKLHLPIICTPETLITQAS
ncbi:MAG: type II toxin-antitoxin system VapC family toxin [Verrucomicrobiaceae bacterium]|nr:type II toxin-antitoxin system VapC family toxin [Verrucomicrobiaceae bacterium]